MSMITNAVMKRLYDDAQTQDEHATTRLWEYILKLIFKSENWVIASQQPSTSHIPLRRVDLIIEYLSLESGTGPKVLMMEAKRYAATPTDINEVEGQGYEASWSYSYFETKSKNPVWYLTCVGTKARIWICDPSSEIPVSFLPGGFDTSLPDEYLDIKVYGSYISTALKYIKDHHEPPYKFVIWRSPSVTPPAAGSSESGSPRSVRKDLTIRAAAENRIPLQQESWIEIQIDKIIGGEIHGIIVGKFEKFSAPLSDWKLQLWGDKGDVCWACIDKKTYYVYWTPARSLDIATNNNTSQLINLGETDNPGSDTSELMGLEWTENPGPSNLQGGEQLVDTDNVEVNAAPRESTSDWISVKVTVEPHFTGKDNWIFMDGKSKVRRSRIEWSQKEKDGMWVWTLKRRGKTYYTTQNIYVPKGKSRS